MKGDLSEEDIAEFDLQISILQAVIDAGADDYIYDEYYQIGYYQFRLGDLKAARAAYEIVVEGDPGNETAWNNLGDIFVEMGDVEGAENMYLNAIEALPSEQAYRKLVQYLETYHPGRVEDVGGLLKQAVEDNPSSGSLWAMLAEWYVDQEDYESAVAAYNTAVELRPNNSALKSDLEEAIRLREGITETE